MPIEASIPLHAVLQSEFGAVAYEVVGYAFTVHKQLGRIFDESVYRNTMAHILNSRVVEEVCIRLTHSGFEKPYFIDLVVDAGCPFELTCLRKTTDVESYERHLVHFLANTTLEMIFWVNVVSGNVRFVWLSK